MKRIISVLVITAFFTACNESGVNVNVDTDSLNKKLENVGEKIEDKAGQVWDSTKEKAADLKDKAEQKLDSTRERNRDNDTTDKQ
jgi:ElaB/YqjD/DUF883 family membrane-anchored ribosome-binding protein